MQIGTTQVVGQSGTQGANLPVDAIAQASNMIAQGKADLTQTAGAEHRLDGFDGVGGGGGGGGQQQNQTSAQAVNTSTSGLGGAVNANPAGQSPTGSASTGGATATTASSTATSTSAQPVSASGPGGTDPRSQATGPI